MDWLLDALLDSLKLIPFLFLAYVLIEYLETVTSKKLNNKFLKGKYAPLLGASFGIVPQCGFSVVATDLYSHKKITVGTLIAIFIATSDEAIPILLSNLNSGKIVFMLFMLILVKFVVGIISGYVIDFIVSKNTKLKPITTSQTLSTINIEQEHTHTKEESIKDYNNATAHTDTTLESNASMPLATPEATSTLQVQTVHKGCCGHDIEENKTHPAKQYVLHPLIHTLKIFAYILIVNLIFGACIHYLGEDKIAAFLSSGYYIAPLIACLIGLIPNCASSVVLTNLLIIGGLSFSACVAGLIVNAGIAYLVLFKQNKNLKHNFLIISLMVLIGIITGYLLMIFGI